MYSGRKALSSSQHRRLGAAAAGEGGRSAAPGLRGEPGGGVGAAAGRGRAGEGGGAGRAAGGTLMKRYTRARAHARVPYPGTSNTGGIIQPGAWGHRPASHRGSLSEAARRPGLCGCPSGPSWRQPARGATSRSGGGGGETEEVAPTRAPPTSRRRRRRRRRRQIGRASCRERV